jgi:hypothetical protein
VAVSPSETMAQEVLSDLAFDLWLGYSNIIRLQQQMLKYVRRMQSEVARVRYE